MQATPADGGMRAARRPHPRLLTYYALQSLATGPLFPFIMVPRFFRFRTLRYEFDDEGVTMRWGILFRREVSLTYERIQDLHLVSNIIERWLGLGRIQVQTASGSAEAEMTIEGLQDYEVLRDRLYTRMRGARSQETRELEGGTTGAAGWQQAAAAIREAAAELRAIRERLDNPSP